MPYGITRAQIIKNFKGKLKKGSFDLYCAKAGIKMIDKRPSKKKSHLIEYIYPPDSVERLKAVMGVE